MVDQTSSLAGNTSSAPVVPLKKRLLQQFVEASPESAKPALRQASQIPSEAEMITVQPLCTVFPVSSTTPSPSVSTTQTSTAAISITVIESDEETPSEMPVEKNQRKASEEAVNARLKRRREIMKELRS